MGGGLGASPPLETPPQIRGGRRGGGPTRAGRGSLCGPAPARLAVCPVSGPRPSRPHLPAPPGLSGAATEGSGRTGGGVPLRNRGAPRGPPPPLGGRPLAASAPGRAPSGGRGPGGAEGPTGSGASPSGTPRSRRPPASRTPRPRFRLRGTGRGGEGAEAALPTPGEGRALPESQSGPLSGGLPYAALSSRDGRRQDPTARGLHPNHGPPGTTAQSALSKAPPIHEERRPW